MMKIIVVGSGVIGLSCALLLAFEGYKVQVITRNPEEATSWTAGGMLAPFSEGLEGELFDFSYQSLKEYPDFIRLLSDVSKQRVDFWQEGIYRVVLEGEEELLKVAERYKRAGYGVELLQKGEDLSKDVISLIHYTEEAWVDAEMLMDALLFAMNRLGVDYVVDEITSVMKKEEEIESIKGIKSEYRGDFYVFALGSWTKELFDLPVYPIKGQALKLKGASLSRVHYSSISYLIPREKYLYVGATSEDVGFMGGNTLEGLKQLSEGAIRIVPTLSKATLMNTLYGYRPATPDEKPIFQVGENYFIATGHYRNGILHAPITARVVKDHIKGESSPFVEFFSYRRFA